MNKKLIWWLTASFALFLGFAGLTVYFSVTPHGTQEGPAEVVTVSMGELLEKVTQGTIREGIISYQANGSGFAEVRAESVGHAAATDGPTVAGGAALSVAVSKPWLARGRLTDADLQVLRSHRFLEVNAASAAPKPAARGFRDYAVPFVEAATQILGLGLLMVVLVLVVQRMVGRGNAFAAKALQPVQSAVKFSSVAGCNEAKEEVTEIVEFLKDPARFKATGGRMPKGVLLVGPPGTGKTMLAKAVAGEAKAKFYSLSGSDFVEMYVGVGAARVRSLFREARKNAPSIVFIDEIDSVGRQRSGGAGGNGNQEQEQTLNALLVEMDGFGTDEAVVVFGATNRADIIDKALQRPGRFDRQVFVGLPDLKGRAEILKVHAGAVKLDDAVNLDEVAKTTSGFSGADLANLINEGALHAARRNGATVTMSDLDDARDKISWGRENPKVMTPQDRKIIAYHEAGHALMQVLAGGDYLKLHKVTIIPRGQSLGSTQFTPERDLLNYSQEQILGRLWCLMAGRVAEELAIGSITSGASCDIQQASSIARQMVFEWGMSPFGFLALSKPDSAEPLASPQTIYEAEQHVKSLLAAQYAHTTAQLRENRAALDAIAGALLEKETISGEEVRRLAGRN